MSPKPPLASVLIPAYNEAFFGEAFASALAQTYSPIEIVVSDDSPGEAIGAIVANARDPRVRYVRNSPRLGFGGNFSQCLSLARGEYIKFLNDDDRLRPRCVEVLAGVLSANPAVVLATSRRAVIDERGQKLPDSASGWSPAHANAMASAVPLAVINALLPGVELGDFVLANSTNYIGEPTTVLFRRAALELEDGVLFRWGGRDYHCLADMSLWLRLLLRGPAYYVAWTLSEFRIHGRQEQLQAAVMSSCLAEWLWIARHAHGAGFLASPSLHRAALENARARIVAWLDVNPPGQPDRQALEEVLAELDRDLSGLPA